MMVVEEADVAVVGAGPTGLIAAREASRRGVNVVVLEEHGEIGVPCHCAGLLSIEGLRRLGIPQDEKFVQNKVRGARFFSPSGLSFTVEKKESVACVVDRRALDNFLAEQASGLGASIRTGFHAEHLRRVDGGIVVLSGRGEALASRVVVDAEGVASRIVGEAGLKTLPRGCVFPALQFDFSGVSLNPDYVEVHLGSRVAPSFFAWVIPLREDAARVGLACKGASPRTYLRRFIKRRFGSHGHLQVLASRSGLVVTCGPIEKTYTDNMIVVGDAAGQVKPLTGGGVILGGECALIAGEVAAEAAGEGKTSKGFLERYERMWRRRFGLEFKVTGLARKVLNSLSDRTLDRLFRAVIDGGLDEEASASGDMDMHGWTILRMLRSREVLKVLPEALRDMLARLRREQHI
ncbi:NAD(P)/FAD-dependent oxidoreductase [Candidatus Bathyarchaeota archaeon]|nr:MAG: NAD(P)/FAD-dependent oxidoreductase [Candidatus Bathyarchaeota archaeon]